ncbi:MAG TPA: hypothetical protein VGK73_32305 [Polyangiaceae bacterium]
MDLVAMLESLEWAGAIEMPSDLADDRQGPACPHCEALQPGVFERDDLEAIDCLDLEGHTAKDCKLRALLARARAWQARQARAAVTQ